MAGKGAHARAKITLGRVGAKGGEAKYEKPEARREFFLLSIVLWPFRKIKAGWGRLARVYRAFDYNSKMLEKELDTMAEDLQDLNDEFERANREMESALKATEEKE